MPNVTMPDGTVVAMPDQLDAGTAQRLRAFQQQGPKPQDDSLSIGDIVKGGLSTIGNVAANIPHTVAHGISGLVQRIGGNSAPEDPALVRDLAVEPNAAQQKLAAHIPALHLPGDEGSGDVNEAATFGSSGPTHNDFVRNYVAPALGDAADASMAVPAADALRIAAKTPGAVVRAAGDALANKPTTSVGFRTGSEGTGATLAKTAAGASGREAVSLANQDVGNALGNAAANVPHGTPLSYDATAAGRAAPESVYAATASTIPTGPLSDAAKAKITSAGIDPELVTGSDTARAAIEAQKQKLLTGDFTGEGVIKNIRSLRQEGGANVSNPALDVDKQQLGKAQLQMASGLEQHVADSLPAGGAVTADQFQNARKALAQNWAVEGALRGKDLDLQAIARIQRADPDLMDGPLKEIADFANQHPEVTTLPSPGARFLPPSTLKDIGGINLAHPTTWPKPLVGSFARRVLTGNPEASVGAAQRAFPGHAPSEFEPQPLNGLQPPPGQAFTPHQPQLATGDPQRSFFGTGADGMTASPPTGGAPPAVGHPDDIPLADLLSHGVEHIPPELLSLAQEPRTYGGVPFQRNAAHEAGDLTLGDHFGGSVPGNNADLGHVMSQGVPEGIVARGGSDPASLNAASPEAISRGTRPLIEINPDGNERTILKDVTQIDAKATKGHVLLDPSTGEIIDRGGLSQSAANGLRNRWATMGRQLGDHFVTGGSGG